MLSPTPPIRLCSILGYDDRVNDIIFCPPAIQSDEHSTVIYFGGDVQVLIALFFQIPILNLLYITCIFSGLSRSYEITHRQQKLYKMELRKYGHLIKS